MLPLGVDVALVCKHAAYTCDANYPSICYARLRTRAFIELLERCIFALDVTVAVFDIPMGLYVVTSGQTPFVWVAWWTKSARQFKIL